MRWLCSVGLPLGLIGLFYLMCLFPLQAFILLIFSLFFSVFGVIGYQIGKSIEEDRENV